MSSGCLVCEADSRVHGAGALSFGDVADVAYGGIGGEEVAVVDVGFGGAAAAGVWVTSSGGAAALAEGEDAWGGRGGFLGNVRGHGCWGIVGGGGGGWLRCIERICGAEGC